jgi:hypothetical protein
MRRYPYVYITADGSARELHAGERARLQAAFRGGIPAIKESYAARDGNGALSGYLARAHLPAGLAVAAAPADDPLASDPRAPVSRAGEIAQLRAWGVDVAENADGSLTILARPRQ